MTRRDLSRKELAVLCLRLQLVEDRVNSVEVGDGSYQSSHADGNVLRKATNVTLRAFVFARRRGVPVY